MSRSVDDLKTVFVQAFFEDCNKEQMEGTKRYPFFMAGSSFGFYRGGYDVFYPPGTEREYPGIITPSVIKRIQRLYDPENIRINIQIGKTYRMNLPLPEDRRIGVSRFSGETWEHWRETFPKE